MAKIITFAAWKGGVGKTTLIYNLSLLAQEKKILLIDIDSQCNLTNAFVKNTENNVLNNPIPLNTEYPNIHIIPSNIVLANNLSQLNIKNLIETNQNKYDYIVFDTPPSLNNYIIKAFDLSNEVYLITDASSMSYTGLLTTLTQYDIYCQTNNKQNNIKAIILNNLNRFKLTEEFIDSLKKNPKTKDLLIEPYIYKKSSIYKTLIFKKPITSMKDKQASQLLLELSKKIFK